MSTEVKYINLTFTAPNGEGEVGCPTLDDPTDRAEIERAARRAFWSLVAAGYGDVDDVKIFYNGERILMDPQKEQS